ncbi:MAG: ATP synthase F1 subunit epsilon [Lachnospiraceae bacterium]|jgi:F-type H+-transporting ATPase subunit epsilon|nr:ATP synthase F1 subunit epsilon [Lachnospiraceae bacterium]
MAENFKLQIITPDRKFYQGDVEMVELTTTEGQIGVYARHIPLTAVVAPGILKIHENAEVKAAALMSGFIQVMPEQVTIMAEIVEWPEEIDENRAKEAKIRAERRIQSHDAEMDVARAELALKRALVRLEARQ